jgi:hypothetical protein
VGSVRLVLDGVTTHDNAAPYMVAAGTALTAGGTHTLVATPYRDVVYPRGSRMAGYWWWEATGILRSPGSSTPC